jgi:hypothetical protein
MTMTEPDTESTRATTPQPQFRRRALVALGGLLALVTAVVAPAVPGGAQVEAPPDDGETTGDPVGATANGEFEPCSEDFGLGKGVEVVVEVDGSVPSPPLTYPADVQLVVDFDPGDGSTATCAPIPITPENWVDTIWGGGLGIAPPTGNFVYLPVGEESPCDAEFTLRLVGAPPEYQVTVGTATVFLTDPLLCGQSPEELFELVLTPEQTTALLAFLDAGDEGDPFPVEGCNEDGSGTPSTALQGALDGLKAALSPEFLAAYENEVGDPPPPPCDQEAAQILATIWLFQVIFDGSFGQQAVFELATVPVDPIVIVPRFTG